MGWLRRWRRRRLGEEMAARRYGEVVAWARDPILYARYGVPDTPEGRFEMLVLHLVAAACGLRRAGEETLAQALVDLFFADLDRSLREMGVGDLSVGRQVKRLGELFLARSRRLSAALAGGGDGEADVVDLLRRNLPMLEMDGATAIARRLFDLADHCTRSAARKATTGAI